MTPTHTPTQAGIKGCPKANTVLCPVSAAPVQGSVHGKGRHVGAVRVFDCEAATHLDGEPVSVCKQGGEWSHRGPVCVITTTTTTITRTTTGLWIFLAPCMCNGYPTMHGG